MKMVKMVKIVMMMMMMMTMMMMIMVVVVVVVVVMVVVMVMVTSLYEDVASVELNKKNIRLSCYNKETKNERICARENASFI